MQRWRVGDVDITSVVDLEVPIPVDGEVVPTFPNARYLRLAD